MKTNTRPSSGIKFSEAAVLFVLILGLTVFVGVRVVSRGQTEHAIPPSATVVSMESPAVESSKQELNEATVDTAVVMKTEAPQEEAKLVSPQLVTQEPVTYAEAELAFTSGKFDQAVDLFTDYTLQHPANAWGEYMLGMSLWKAEDPDGAVESFQAALLINPDHVKSLVNEGRVLLELGRPGEALQTLTTAVQLDPENVAAQRVLARAQNNAGHHDLAENTYRGVLATHPEDVWSLNNLGLLLIQEERFPEALPILSRAVQINGQLPAIQNNLATALERSGYVAAAKEAYARTIALDDSYEKAHASLARLEQVFEAKGLAPFDLAATAAQFNLLGTPVHGPNPAQVATATSPTATEAKPEQTATKNR